MPLSTTQYGFIIDPMVPFTDASGTTIRNGYVRVFVAGSSTPVITYKNYDGATNEETIQLDNSGRTAYPVIVSKGNTYKVCVYDAEHSQETPIKTIDKVVPTGASVNATNVVTGLDNVTVQEENFLKATVEGTEVELALDPTEVTDEVSTSSAAVTAAPDYVVPLLDKTGEGDSKKISLANLFKFALDWISRLATTISSFASGDYIAVSNPTEGARKMSKDDLLRVTAQNALAGNVAPAFDPTRTSDNPYKAGEIVAYNGKVYSFKVNHYGAWAGADVEQEPESQVFSRVLNNGIFEKITQMVAVEAGGYSNGKKTTNAARMRLNVPLLSPFRISTKSGYLIHTYQRLDKNGIYIDFLSVGARNLNVDSIDGYLYCVVFRKSDNSNFTEGENPIDSLEYLGGIDIYKNFILESGCLGRLNGGVVTEIGSFYQGKKIASDNRLRFNFPVIAPFSISTKTGFLVANVIEINNDGSSPIASTIDSYTYTKSTSKGKKYLVTFRKSDNSDFVGGEDVIKSFEYFGIGDIIDNFNSFKETNNGVIERLNGVVVAEAGGYSNGKKTTNAARMRLNVPLIPPFKVYAKTGYIIQAVHITNNDGVYESFVSPESTEYSQTTTSGKKYLVVFRKDDNTDFTEGENPLDHIDYEYGAYEQKRVPDSKTDSCDVFARVGVIGDSYAAGYIKIDSDARIIASDYSWPAFMGRRTNRTWTNFAKSGSSCKSWVVNDNPTFSNIDAVQAEGNKCQAYVIGLQINDKSLDNPYYTPAGDLTDIGTSNDTYCAYLYTLISLVHAVNADAKIFVCTLPSINENDGYNAIVRGVVDHCKETDGWNVYCIDLYAYKDYFTSNETFVNDASYGHYTAVGYEFMAEMLFAVISKVIDSAESEFKDVYRIDYDS